MTLDMNVDELMVLYNCIYVDEPGEITFGFPFFDITLFRYDMYKDEVRYIIPSWKFQRAKENVLDEASSFLGYDSPRWADLKDAFQKAGLLRYPNLDTVNRALDSIIGDSRNRSLHPRNPVLALDTNILYNRFVSRSMHFSGENGMVSPGDFKYVVSVLVREELDGHVDKKYLPSLINEMEHRYGRGDIVREFSNGSARANRKAKDAIVEMRYVVQELGAAIADFQGERPGDKEAMDRAIVKSYADYQRGTGSKVILLTCDQDMAFHASNAGLSSIVVSVPYHMPNHFRSSPVKWTRLLNALAVSFGVVEIEGICTVLSEWRGKDHRSYGDSEVRVKIHDRNTYKKARKWLELCRSVRCPSTQTGRFTAGGSRLPSLTHAEGL